MKTQYRFNEVSHVEVQYKARCRVRVIEKGERYDGFFNEVEEDVARTDRCQKWRILSLDDHYRAKEDRYRLNGVIGTVGFILKHNSHVGYENKGFGFYYRPNATVHFIDGQQYTKYFDLDEEMEKWLDEKFPNLNTRITKHEHVV